MSALGSGGGTSYPSAIDTAIVEVNAPNAGQTKARAEVPNDYSAAIIAVETTLGTSPQGTKIDVKTFLQTQHGVDGTHNPSIIVMTSGNQTIAGVKTYSDQQIWSKGVDVASAATLALGTDGNFFDITGTTNVTGIQSKGVGVTVKLQFDDTLTLTHDAANLILPGGENIIVTAGDVCEFVEYSSADWILTGSSFAIIKDDTVITAKIINGAVTREKQFNATVGDVLFHANATEKTTSSTTLVKVKETKIGKGGDFRIKFDMKNVSATSVQGQVYRNGSPIGTLQSTSSATDVTFSEDIVGWSVDDTVEIWGKRTGGIGSCVINDFNLYIDEVISGDSIL